MINSGVILTHVKMAFSFKFTLLNLKDQPSETTEWHRAVKQ